MRNDPRTLTRRIEVGQRLRELRQTRGLTQGELARAGRLGQATLSNYESGRRDILLGMTERVAEALGVTLGYLLDVPHIWVIRDPELARAVRILADSEELLTSIVGPRPPLPPRPRRARRRARRARGEAQGGEAPEAEPTEAEADAADGEGEAQDGEHEAPEAEPTDGEAEASNGETEDDAAIGEAQPTEAEHGATDGETGAANGEADVPDGEAEASNGEADSLDAEAEGTEGEGDTTGDESEATEAEPGDAEVEPVRRRVQGRWRRGGGAGCWYGSVALAIM